MIKANKDILEQLYADIAELEGRKHKLEEGRYNLDRESESSRDALSEINALAQLESELTMKNRHIRKLLGDVKVRPKTFLTAVCYSDFNGNNILKLTLTYYSILYLLRKLFKNRRYTNLTEDVTIITFYNYMNQMRLH